MFDASPVLTRPDWSLQPLWRYLSANRLLDLVSSEELFFAHLPILEDAREGALTNRTREHLANWFQSHGSSSRTIAYAEVDEYQKKQRDFYVNCWHMNGHESYLMWKAYAHRGFAVETTFERLQASLEASTGIVTGGVVEYVDFNRDLTVVGNVFNHVAVKDMPYRDEREFRLVFWDVDPRNKDYPKVVNGVRVKVDIKMLLRNIVRSPFSDPLSSELECALERHGMSFAKSAVSVRPMQ